MRQNLKNQILSTNVWLEHRWFDRRLTWSQAEYGQIDKLHLLPDKLYLPDIVLLNNADGNYEIRTTNGKALVHSNGLVEWRPRVRLKSNCRVDLHSFPLDSQQCSLRFGTWTRQPSINLQLTNLNQTIDHNKWHLTDGIDLSAFEPSSEYAIVAAPAQLVRKRSPHYSANQSASYYSGHSAYRPKWYQEAVFTVHLKRKSLFYTLHLILPCMVISALSILVFQLPTQSKEKLTLSVTLLVILLVFSLLLAELVPSTNSLSVPLINRYLLYTLCQVTLSVLLSVLVIRVGDRSHCTTPGWLSHLLLRHLSNLLKIRRPDGVAPANDFTGTFTGAFTGTPFPHLTTRNPSTTNSTARSSISGFCHPSVACQSLVAKYGGQLKGSQSELNSRLVQSRRSTGVEEEDEERNTATHSSRTSTSKSTNSSKRSSSSSSSSQDSFERNRLKKESSLVQADLKNDDDDLANRLQNRLQHNDPHSTKPRRPPEFEKAVYNLDLLQRNARNEQLHSKVQSDWQFLAILLDRLFLWLSALSCLAGWLMVLGYVLSFV